MDEINDDECGTLHLVSTLVAAASAGEVVGTLGIAVDDDSMGYRALVRFSSLNTAAR